VSGGELCAIAKPQDCIQRIVQVPSPGDGPQTTNGSVGSGEVGSQNRYFMSSKKLPEKGAGRKPLVLRRKFIMKSLYLSIALAALGSFGTAFGATVQFDTLNSQLCVGAAGCNSKIVDFGGNTLRLTYNPFVSANLNANPLSSTNFGSLTLNCTDGGNPAAVALITTCGSSALPVGLNLYLRFNQVLPQAGMGAIDSETIVGTIGGNSGNATITWSVPSTTINTAGFSISYRVTNNPLNIVTPAGGGVTTIQGEVRDNMVPEPATYAMLGGALIGLVLLRRRKA